MDGSTNIGFVNVPFVLGAVLLGLIIWTGARAEYRLIQRLRWLRRRYGLNWRESSRFHAWLLRQADIELDNARLAGFLSSKEMAEVPMDAYYDRWMDRFLKRAAR